MSTAPSFKSIRSILPNHITQSDDNSYLTCTRCFQTSSLAYDPNYRGFISEHEHPEPALNAEPRKIWKSTAPRGP